jgi:hypothetical protein
MFTINIHRICVVDDIRRNTKHVLGSHYEQARQHRPVTTMLTADERAAVALQTSASVIAVAPSTTTSGGAGGGEATRVRPVTTLLTADEARAVLQSQPLASSTSTNSKPASPFRAVSVAYSPSAQATSTSPSTSTTQAPSPELRFRAVSMMLTPEQQRQYVAQRQQEAAARLRSVSNAAPVSPPVGACFLNMHVMTLAFVY